MALKPGYKQTEVGVIPEDWEAHKISNLCSLINGRGFKPHEWQTTGLPIIRIQNLNGSEEFNYYSGSYNPKILVEHGQLLFAWSGSRGTSFGPHIWKGSRALLNYHTWKVLVNESEINGYFLFYALQQLTAKIEDKAHGASALVHTQKGEMEQFLIPVPPTKTEQEAIAEVLGDVDELLAGLDRLIAKKRDLKQATMQQLLTGRVRLPGFSAAWELNVLENLLDRLCNGAVYQPTYNEGFPVTRIETIANGTIDMNRVGLAKPTTQLETYQMKIGDILFSHINSLDHIGKVAFYSGEPPLYHGMNLLLLRVKSFINSKFLFFWLGSFQGRKKTSSLAKQSVNQASINTNELKSIQLLVPPLPEQTAIAEILTEMDHELATLEQQRAKTQALKQALLQELLTGKTRLI